MEIATGIATAAFFVTVAWNYYQHRRFVQIDTTTLENRLAKLESNRIDATDLENRLATIETKMGLFWRMVEDHLATLLSKANPINLTPEEKAAAKVYEMYKRDSPTDVLETLDAAIGRELPNLNADERIAFILIRGAIQAQLTDRHCR